MPRRRTPLRSRTSGRARSDHPLAVYCEAVTEVCTGRAEHRHHRLPRSGGGSDEATNTADVCGACHRFIHANPAVSYPNGWLIHSWEAP